MPTTNDTAIESGGDHTTEGLAPSDDNAAVVPRNVPRYCSLEGFAEVTRQLDGVCISSLEPFDTIYARTRNSEYQIFLLDPASGRALVQGGRVLPEPAEAIVRGSTFGGCMLKLGWIGLELHIEIRAGGKTIVTSPVEAIRVERDLVPHDYTGIC